MVTISVLNSHEPGSHSSSFFGNLRARISRSRRLPPNCLRMAIFPKAPGNSRAANAKNDRVLHKQYMTTGSTASISEYATPFESSRTRVKRLGKNVLD